MASSQIFVKNWKIIIQLPKKKIKSVSTDDLARAKISKYKKMYKAKLQIINNRE